MRHFLLATLVATSPCVTASAQDRPTSLKELFAPLSQGACARMDDVRAVGRPFS
jgi:hypothetical protein